MCMPGNCRVDSDCESGGGYCSPSQNAGLFVCSDGCSGTCGGGLTGYYCHTAADECVNDCDCAGLAPPSGPVGEYGFHAGVTVDREFIYRRG